MVSHELCVSWLMNAAVIGFCWVNAGATYYIEVFSQRYHTQIDKALERYNELLAMHKGNTVVQDKDSGSPADVVERSNTS